MGWFSSAMENFTDALCGIAVIFKILRQCYCVRLGFAKMCTQIPYLNCVRPQPGQHRKTRWTANCLLAVGPIKDDAPFSQAINIRSFCHLIPIAPQCRPQIINCYKKNIEPILAKCIEPNRKYKTYKSQQPSCTHLIRKNSSSSSISNLSWKVESHQNIH